MQEDLETIFDNVNDWLKFAEAKSATLLAANGLVIFGLLRAVQSLNLEMLPKIAITTIFSLFAFSLLLCLSSFIPSLKLPFVENKKDINEKDNLLFFNHIEKYGNHAYLKALAKSKGVSENDFTSFDYMLADQIIINSTIASYKYRLFKKAVWSTLLGVILSMPLFALFVFVGK